MDVARLWKNIRRWYRMRGKLQKNRKNTYKSWKNKELMTGKR